MRQRGEKRAGRKPGHLMQRKGTGMIDEIRASLTRHLPSYEVRSIAKLGEGSDNVVYEVNGELIVRVSKETDPVSRSESTRREAGLLAVVAELSTLPVPEPIFTDIEAGCVCVKPVVSLSPKLGEECRGVGDTEETSGCPRRSLKLSTEEARRLAPCWWW